MRTILFIDPPAFCTTLEVLQDPQLRRRPVAIAPLAADRAVLLAVSAEARLAGVVRGMAVALARRICPDLVVRPPDPARYAKAHRALHAILAEVAPVIEPRGWGHAYLDLTGTERLFGPATAVARRLERSVRERLSLPLAVGVAINKLVSESAATVVKREAGADIWAVAPGYEAAFLAPEPVALLPEVPESVRRRLDDYHLDRIGEVAAIGETPLRVAFGAAGGVLHRHAHGIDPRPVLPPEVQAAMRLTHELSTDTNDREALAAMLRPLAEEIGRRLRARRLMAGRVVVTVRHADDTTAERAVAVGASPLDAELWRAACRALDAALVRRVAVRSLVLTAAGLHDGGGQLELWPATEFNVSPKAAALQQAVDRMQEMTSAAAIRPRGVNGER
jgi:DNA polymerase-4